MTLEQRRDRLHQLANTLSSPLTSLLARAGVTPDVVTVAGLVLCAAAAACLAGGAVRTAGVVWLLGSALDLVDGALARRNGMAAGKGAFLDSSLDRVSEGLMLTAAVYQFAHQGMALAAAASAYALLVSFMVSYTRARAESLGVACKGGLATRVERVLLISLGLLFNILAAAVAVLGVLATITTAQRVFHVRSALAGAEGASGQEEGARQR
jgi:CDP-diacylglycerol--glycerol-3-phosphate 3-phosphatidyltransferase